MASGGLFWHLFILMVDSSPSPLPPQPFVELCLQHGNRREAIKYVQRLPPEGRFKIYMKME